jgi:sugar/nucleoside kinase (ribokinase family)
MKFLVVGNLVLDQLAWPVEKIRWDGTVWVEQLVASVGGNGANTSYALAKLGAQVALAGAVGRDREGDELLGLLTRAGVDVTRVKRSSLSTPATLALVKRQGARAFIHRPGASREALQKVIAMRGFDHLHIANPYGVPALRRLALAFLAAARKAGLSTSLDAGWDSRGEWGAVALPCLEHLDLLFLNEEEARLITGESTWRKALPKLSAARHVILKRGKRGAAVDGELIPGFPVNAVDSTGAGDVFAGAFLAAWGRGFALPEAARFANAAASFAVQSLGSVAGLPDFAQVLRRAKTSERARARRSGGDSARCDTR